ncbi:hypothetical protein COU54_02740 [Candidatus Pacearchaeota archaeon CG10_big_fil_rev_8_21_14_0_10_31_24]|nr:MAG: hypothetical protein COU54_02740 [Candidatus Pacearchaeota archaeon CG10_big_fil_rev_8_21_14_0_10_31_24]
MVRREVFVCDNCELVSTILLEGANPPYHQGWKRLESFEFQSSENCTHPLMRKHFCSSNCMLDFLEKFMRTQEEEFHNNPKNKEEMKLLSYPKSN